MLESIRIQNLAVIESTEIHFQSGLTILSGETGAGKSIVIQAVALLLGERATSDLIRSGCDEATVEGLFDLTRLKTVRARLEECGIDAPEPTLLIKRSVHRSGKNRIYLNGQVATLTLLQSVAEGLIDLCSQHEHQSLTRAQTQLELLDRYGNLSKSLAAYQQAYSEWKELERERVRLLQSESDRLRQIDFLRFQIEEIKNAHVLDASTDEDADLVSEKQLLQSAESRAQLADAARKILEDETSDSSGALTQLQAAVAKLRTLEALDPSLQNARGALERASAEAEDCAFTLNRYLGSIEVNAERLGIVQERLLLLSELKRKYGGSLNDVRLAYSRLSDDLQKLEQHEQSLAQLQSQIHAVESALKKAGTALSTARAKAGKLFSNTITAELQELKMVGAAFHVSQTQREELSDWGAMGADEVEFLVQTNPGEAAKPLGKIASGGELSRLMLAIRRTIADQGGIGVYLFDEIDAGISGQTAFVVGQKLQSVAKHNQVICITHLPQVAAFADHHWVVRKEVRGKRTTTAVVELSKTAERKEELARLLGGPKLTPKSLENAAELLQLAH